MKMFSLMRLFAAPLFTAASVTCITLPSLAQTPEPTQQTVAPAVVSLEGEVRETFLNRFILESGTSRFLVEPMGTAGVFSLVLHERLTVTGRQTKTLIQATRIVRPNGEVIHDSTLSSPASSGLASAPAASKQSSIASSQTKTENAQRSQPQGIREILAGLGLEPLDEAVRKRHHTEILARMSDGRSVYVSFDLSGKLWEIEDANYDRESVREGSPLPDSELLKLATTAGFTPEGDIERRKRHAVVPARNKAGESLELHIDKQGYIFKQVWRR